MKNVNVKLILFYLVFMAGIKANAQTSVVDSNKYSKELSIDIATKLNFIKSNDPKGYKILLDNLYLNSEKYSRNIDSLRNLAKIIIREQTGDGDLIDSWEVVSKDTLKKDGQVLDLFELNKATMLIEKSKEELKNQNKQKDFLIDKEFIGILDKIGGWDFSSKPVKMGWLKRMIVRFSGKTK
ncbi:MAG TPA: hypothetical protein PLZ05_00260 [Alphaproteobacteria bacterium]|nr:hypothetical protein [Alphaproteobacteria bacterium]